MRSRYLSTMWCIKYEQKKEIRLRNFIHLALLWLVLIWIGMIVPRINKTKKICQFISLYTLAGFSTSSQKRFRDGVKSTVYQRANWQQVSRRVYLSDGPFDMRGSFEKSNKARRQVAVWKQVVVCYGTRHFQDSKLMQTVPPQSKPDPRLPEKVRSVVKKHS